MVILTTYDQNDALFIIVANGYKGIAVKILDDFDKNDYSIIESD